MLFPGGGVDDNVIQIKDTNLVDETLEYLVHQSLESTRGILEAKWHDAEPIAGAIWRHKRSVVLASLSNWNLPIAVFQVQGGEDLCISQFLQRPMDD